jgi:hypothetical protein
MEGRRALNGRSGRAGRSLMSDEPHVSRWTRNLRARYICIPFQPWSSEGASAMQTTANVVETILGTAVLIWPRHTGPWNQVTWLSCFGTVVGGSVLVLTMARQAASAARDQVVTERDAFIDRLKGRFPSTPPAPVVNAART